ncbi:MAG: HlyD family type I secretion periplasmic adaptor subunit [Anaerolineae bacterium]|nr:HlyD family type I secretion periplasmic adaptor subunit [Anaerolineae bacterium]
MMNTKRKDELEFLPAALEIQETPPLPMSRYILWAIMLFFVIAITWACIGEVDIVGVAQGKIIPSGKVKIIQPLETGLVRNIFVKEGDRVEQGQALIELDTTLVGAEHTQVKEQQLALKLDRARLLSVLDYVNETDKADHFIGIHEANDAQINLQRERINQQINEYTARGEALKDEKRQRQADRRAVGNRIQQLDATIPLITERVKALEDLLKKDLVARTQWLELEQERIEQVKERDIQKNNLVSLDASIANINQRLAATKAEFESQLLKELTDAENRIVVFEQEKVKAEKRITSQTLNAPVAGTVHQLAINTIGGVVTPAQELMHIIPDEGGIEVEAWLLNKDIGFVHEGQKAEIKVETFPFTKYGLIDAEIINVSNDAIPDERLGLVYAMRVKMFKTTIKVKEKIVNLTPGMAVTVEIKMGKRKLIEFLLSPLLRYKDESVRER